MIASWNLTISERTIQPVFAHCLKTLLMDGFPGFVQWWGAHCFVMLIIALLNSDSCKKVLPHAKWTCLLILRPLVLVLYSSHMKRPVLFSKNNPATAHTSIALLDSVASWVFTRCWYIYRLLIISMFFADYVAAYEYHFLKKVP